MLSIIVPIYNVELYLKECLDSLLGQDLKDIEFLLFIDGSTDNCQSIAEEYSKKDSRFKIIVQENQGYGKTCNNGIDLAKGDYIGIVEPDDIINSRMFSTLYSKAKEHHVDICGADFLYWKENFKKESQLEESTKPPALSLNERLKLADKKINLKENTFALNHYLTSMPAIWSRIYRKNFLDQTSIRFMETKGAAYQDLPFYLEAICSAESVFYVQDFFYYYRQHANNSSQKNKNPFIMTTLLEEIFLKKNLQNMISSQHQALLFKSMLQHINHNFKRISFKNKIKFVNKISATIQTIDWKIDNLYSKEELYFIKSLQKGNVFSRFYATYQYIGSTVQNSFLKKIVKLHCSFINLLFHL